MLWFAVPESVLHPAIFFALPRVQAGVLIFWNLERKIEQGVEHDILLRSRVPWK